MTKIALSLAAILMLAGPAYAHCGACGVGGEDSTHDECASKCADDAACVQECMEKHDKEHGSDKAE